MLSSSRAGMYCALPLAMCLLGGAAAISIRMDNVEQVFRAHISVVGQGAGGGGSAWATERLTRIEVSLSMRQRVLSGAATLLENKLPSVERWAEMCVLFTNVDAEPQGCTVPVGRDLAMPDNTYYCVKLTGIGIEENSKVYKFTGKAFEIIEDIEEEASKMSSTNATARRALVGRRLFFVMAVFAMLVLFTAAMCFFSIKPIR